MADLLTRPLLRRDEPAWGSRIPWLAAIVAAGWALVAGLAMSVLPGVAVWIGEGAVAPTADPLRFGSRLWLAAHRVGLDLGEGTFAFAPLGLTIVFVLLLHRSARWAAHSAGVATTRGALAVIVPAVLTYLLGAGVVAALSATPDIASLPLEAVLWAGLWSGGAVTVGVAHESGLLAEWFLHLPVLVRAGLAGAAAAVAGIVVVGAVLTAVSAVVNADRVGSLAGALDAGLLGGALLAVGGALIVPNAVVWAASFALGPGFGLGASTSVGPGGVELGMVPAVPALGALPADVPGTVTWLVVAGPLLAGALAGLVVHRALGVAEADDADDVAAAAGVATADDVDGSADDRAPEPVPLWTAVGAAAGAGVVAAAGMAALALLSGGSAGAARLSTIGPVPWEVAGATMAFVSVPAALVVLLLRVRVGGHDDDDPDPVDPDPVDPDPVDPDPVDPDPVDPRTVDPPGDDGPPPPPSG